MRQSKRFILILALCCGFTQITPASTVTTVRSSTYDDGSGSTTANLLNWLNTSYGTSHTTLSDALKHAFMVDKGASIGSYPNAYGATDTPVLAFYWNQTNYSTGIHPANPYLSGQTVASEAFWGEAKDSGGSTAGGGLLIGLYTQVIAQETRVFSYVERAAFNNFDLDNDTLPDEWEATYGLDYEISTGVHGGSGDYDVDGLKNYTEYLAGTDPSLADLSTDTDGDGVDDNWEIQYFGTLFMSMSADSDLDSVSNFQEYLIGSDPTLKDTDSDGRDDDFEWLIISADLGDSIVIFTDVATLASSHDVDGDGLSNIFEYDNNLSLHLVDTDGDGLNDGWEDSEGYSASYNQGQFGAFGDYDKDLLSREMESEIGTSWANADDAASIATTNTNTADDLAIVIIGRGVFTVDENTDSSDLN